MTYMTISDDGGGIATLQPTDVDNAGTSNLVLPAQSGNLLTTVLPAGNTTQAPLNFTSGTNRTVAQNGSMEHDGSYFYFTPQNAERGLIHNQLIAYVANTQTGGNDTTTRNIVGRGVTLQSNTLYLFELMFSTYKVSGSSSNAWEPQYLFSASTCTVNWFAMWLVPTNAQLDSYGDIRVNRLLTVQNMPTNTGGSQPYNNSAWIKGIISVDSGGSFIPQWKCSATPGVVMGLKAGAHMIVTPLGPTSTSSVGAWF